MLAVTPSAGAFLGQPVGKTIMTTGAHGEPSVSSCLLACVTTY